jgi:hypothetical protein
MNRPFIAGLIGIKRPFEAEQVAQIDVVQCDARRPAAPLKLVGLRDDKETYEIIT